MNMAYYRDYKFRALSLSSSYPFPNSPQDLNLYIHIKNTHRAWLIMHVVDPPEK